MVRQILITSCIVVLELALLGCDNTSNPSPDSRATSDRTPGPINPNADNTANNRSDRSSSTVTPFDQSESQSDIKITAEIRRAIMKADGMSVNAQNCKVITDQGVVTLRGPVNSQAEKDAIGALVSAVPGVVRMDNLLEVKVSN